MNIIHNTRESIYRNPFGARPTNAGVDLHLDVDLPEEQVDFVLLHYAYGLKDFVGGRRMMLRCAEARAREKAEDKAGPAGPARLGAALRQPLECLDPQRFEVHLRTPDESCLLFYWFQVRLTNHQSLYVFTDPARPGRAAVSTEAPRFGADEDRAHFPFQITVYEADFRTPPWYAGQCMYQLFPDRFARHADFDFAAMARIKPAPERIFHERWDEEVDIHGRPETGYIACDFYGGSFKGITERLPHLKALGISVLYLNPIFEARSNHRYDTADYLNVDPLLGTMEDFEELVKAAKAFQIGIVLDGVFSHTGADSIYFNKYGRYPGQGAYRAALQKSPSRYYGWYSITVQDHNVHYDSWWGFPELPAVNENDLSFREFVFGPQGVVAHWLRKGVMGFRLDVSDELPDSFIRSLRRTVKRYNPEAVVLGEVWEDASCKISYGSYRDFIFGNTHDSIMNYPFRAALLGFCRAEYDAERLRDLLENIRENYPPMAFAANMNMLSTHDTPRFITAVAGDEDPRERERQRSLRLSPEQRAQGERLLRFAYTLALLYPGTPSLYYGDERNMEGYNDPFSRRTFPWDGEAGQTERHLCALAELRNRYRVLQTGHIEWLASSERGFSFRRAFVSGLDLLGMPVPKPAASSLKEAGGGAESEPTEALISANLGERDWTDPAGHRIAPGQFRLEIGDKIYEYLC